MKELLSQIVDFQRQHFKWKLYASVMVFTGICIAVNFSTDFYSHYIAANPSRWLRWLWASVFYAVPFLATGGLVYCFTDKRAWLTDKRFWARVLLVFAVAGLSQAWKPLDFVTAGLKGADYFFLANVTRKADSLINVLLPVIALYLIFERDSYKSFYGLRSEHWNWKPYAVMFGVMVAAIGVASFFQDLQAYYPRYLRTRGPEFASVHGLDSWIPLLLYELAYGSDFISVELFYRGVLVLAFSRYFGAYAVLLMVPSYVFLHFGKPLTEAISSAFGGYVLGIISLNSRNIWGGVVLHVGVAWLMELFGWIQIIFN